MVRPFANGSQLGDWEASNCKRCKKNRTEDQPICEIDEAISLAYWGDGTVSHEIAQRMGYTKPKEGERPEYVWMCGEVEWTEEWKAEFIGRKEEK